MSQQHEPIGRRQSLRTGMIGVIAAAAASALKIGTAVADTETNTAKRKALAFRRTRPSSKALRRTQQSSSRI